MKRPLLELSGILFVAGTLAVALFLGVPAAEATKADPDVVKTFVQPDGAVLQLRLWGDEFAHWWETLDGYTVVFNAATGYWEYAERDPLGLLVPSGEVVGVDAAPTEPGLKPSQTAIDRIRAERAAPTVARARRRPKSESCRGRFR